MIYHLLYYFREVFTHKMGFYAYQDVLFRSIAAILTSFFIAILLGPKVIRWLMRKKIGDRPEFHHDTLNELTKEKANTPTMGGILIILALLWFIWKSWLSKRLPKKWTNNLIMVGVIS